MELTTLHKRVIACDVHQAQVTVCAILEEPEGSVRIEQQRFGAFQRDRRALAEWVGARRPDVVVMESTGIYWKCLYAAPSRRWAFVPWSSMRVTSRMCRGSARPISVMRNGWPRWRVPGCCAARSCHRRRCASCA